MAKVAEAECEAETRAVITIAEITANPNTGSSMQPSVQESPQWLPAKSSRCLTDTPIPATSQNSREQR